jgi:flavodoxin
MRKEKNMNAVIYVSRGGNTEKLAEAIARGADAEARPAGDAADAARADILFIGASVYAGKMDGAMRRFLQALKPEQAGLAVVFGSAAGEKTVLSEVKTLLEPKGIPVFEEAFHCRGAFLLLNRGRPDAADLERAEAFAKRVCEARRP